MTDLEPEWCPTANTNLDTSQQFELLSLTHVVYPDLTVNCLLCDLFPGHVMGLRVGLRWRIPRRRKRADSVFPHWSFNPGFWPDFSALRGVSFG